jgi:UDP-3-O-[3-hydroxymyristoyl] glucosamine N-acyltransferase
VKLSKLIEVLGGKLAAGSGELSVTGVNSVEMAGPTDLVFAEDASSAAKALASGAGAVVLRAGLTEAYPQGRCVVEAGQPRLWFARAAKLLKPALPVAGVHPAAVVCANVLLGEEVSIGPCAVVGENARIGKGTRIEAGAVIGEGVSIGDDCRIYPRAVLYPGTTLGNRVMVHSGAVLGADGFG